MSYQIKKNLTDFCKFLQLHPWFQSVPRVMSPLSPSHWVIPINHQNVHIANKKKIYTSVLSVSTVCSCNILMIPFFILADIVDSSIGRYTLPISPSAFQWKNTGYLPTIKSIMWLFWHKAKQWGKIKVSNDCSQIKKINSISTLVQVVTSWHHYY